MLKNKNLHSVILYLFCFYRNMYSFHNRELANSKKKFNKFCLKNDIPVPKQYNNNFRFPLVVKVDYNCCGNFVFMNIKNKYMLNNLLKKLRKEHDPNNIIIEKFVKGKNYRILMYKNKIIEVLSRTPFKIKLEKNIRLKDLIQKRITEILNKLPKPDRFYIDEKLIKQKYNLGLNSMITGNTVKKYKYIYLNDLSNYNSGGSVEVVDINTIHKDNIKLFKKVMNTTKLTLAGLDFISQDISKSYKENGGVMNEINICPDVAIHFIANNKGKQFFINTSIIILIKLLFLVFIFYKILYPCFFPNSNKSPIP